MKSLVVSLCAIPALMLTLVAGSAAAQQSQSGLVNVQIGDIETGDILSDITVNVGAGLNLAANVCGVNVGVLARQLGQQGVAHCSTEDQTVTVRRLTGAS